MNKSFRTRFFCRQLLKARSSSETTSDAINYFLLISYQEKEAEINQLKELLFKKTQELKVQKDKEKCVLAEIEGSRTSLKNLKSRLHRLDADALRQEELVYNQVKC